jgi:hypothetical protein
VTVGIIVSIVVILIAVFVGYRWYKRKIAGLALDTEARPVPGVRLTSETLRRLPHPPWRVVIEIGAEHLEGVDHVVIGPTGVIGITTVVADRPATAVERDAMTVAHEAIARAAISAHVEAAGIPSAASATSLAKVFWGAPDPDGPAARVDARGTSEVEGQRLVDWLQSLPPTMNAAGPLSPAQVDAVWRSVLTGIGRPDPLP